MFGRKNPDYCRRTSCNRRSAGHSKLGIRLCFCWRSRSDLSGLSSGNISGEKCLRLRSLSAKRAVAHWGLIRPSPWSIAFSPRSKLPEAAFITAIFAKPPGSSATIFGIAEYPTLPKCSRRESPADTGRLLSFHQMPFLTGRKFEGTEFEGNRRASDRL